MLCKLSKKPCHPSQCHTGRICTMSQPFPDLYVQFYISAPHESLPLTNISGGRSHQLSVFLFGLKIAAQGDPISSFCTVKNFPRPTKLWTAATCLFEHSGRRCSIIQTFESSPHQVLESLPVWSQVLLPPSVLSGSCRIPSR